MLLLEALERFASLLPVREAYDFNLSFSKF